MLIKTFTLQTLRQVCSDISGDLKALNHDDRYSYRYLASKFRDQISYFLRIEARSREILKQSNLWKPIDCVELEDVPNIICGYIDGCDTLKRSVIDIPESYSTNYGNLIKVFTIDGKKELKEIKSYEYSDYINREYGSIKNVFWIENNRIFIPNVTWKAVKVMIMAKDVSQVDKINNNIGCVFPLEAELNYPDYLIKLAKDEVVKTLLSTKPIVEDEKGDDNTNRKN